MKNIFRQFCILVSAMTIIFSGGIAQQEQDLSFQLKKLGPQNAESYLHPMIDGFMSDINSAWYYSAETQDILKFNISLKHVSVLTVDADRKYNLITPEYIEIRNPNTSGTVRLHHGTDYASIVTDAPTVAGAVQDQSVNIDPQSWYYNAYINSHNGNAALYQIPRGYSTVAIPLILPQLSIGLPFGLEAMVRYLPTFKAMNIGDAGKYKCFGYGLRYDITQLLTFLPFDMAMHYVSQKMNFQSEAENDIFVVKGSAYGIEVSKSFSVFTLYAGYQNKNSSFTLNQVNGNYRTFDGLKNQFIIPEQTFSVKNKSHVTLGISLFLFVVNIQAEYSIDTSPVIAVGVGLSSR